MLAAHSLLSIVTFGAGAAEWTNLSYLGIQVAKRRKREARRQTDSPELLTFTSRLESSWSVEMWRMAANAGFQGVKGTMHTCDSSTLFECKENVLSPRLFCRCQRVTVEFVSLFSFFKILITLINSREVLCYQIKRCQRPFVTTQKKQQF